MMKRQRGQHHIQALAALLLFGIFAACILAVLYTGAGAYRRLVKRDSAAYGGRTCTQYIATRVRQSDVAGAVAVERFGGGDCLVLAPDGDGYATFLYCYDGWLRELYAAPEAGLGPETGAPVLQAESLRLSLEEGLLTVAVAGAGAGEDTLYLSLRGEGGAA